MMRRWRCLTVVAALAGGLTVAGPVANAAPAANPAPDVVPGLQQWTGATGQFEFGPQSRIVVADPALLGDARTFAGDLRSIADLNLPVVSGLPSHPGDVVIRLSASDLPAQGYTLDIGDTVSISGVDATGAFYAEQTVEQMVKQDSTLPRGAARDWPQVAHRGFMLDMGRHYYSPAYVEREIRTAAWHKLDAVHLHLTEYNAFRLQSSTYPGLAAEQSYSHADLSAFAATARRYHVTLVPEIDVPAHSTAIADYDPTLKFDCPSLADGFTLDVTKPQTMQFLVGLLKEFVPLFPDSPVFHLGGDEYAGLAAQQACPELVSYAQAHGFGSTEDVFVDFLNKLGAQVQALGKRPEIWNWWDVVGGATIMPDKSLIIDAWTGTADSYLAAGYDTVSSPGNLLYVTPQGPPGGSLEPNDQFLYESWVPPTDPHLLGFEISRWSDNAFTQPDSYFDWFANRPDTVLAARTWGGPRAASVFAFEDQVDRIGTPPGVAEYGPPDATELSGTPYGTSPAFGNSSDTFDKVFDGDPATFFDYSQANGGYAGIDLGHPSQVVKIRFVPRSNQPGRMVGGTFQGCTDGPTSGCHTLATLPWRASYEWTELPVYDQTQYRWLRYVSPAGGFANVAEVQFYGPAPSPVRVGVSAPASLHALGDNTISATVTNTGDAPLLGVGGSLQVTSRDDNGDLGARPASGPIPVVPPHTSTTLHWRVDAPLDAPATAYGIVAHVTWRGGHTEGYGASTLPAPITASLTPAALQLDAGASGRSTLRVESTAGAPVQVAWQATPPSGVGVAPATGSLTVPAGGAASAVLTATAGSTPGVANVPITLSASGGGQTVPISTATLAVSVPYPNFAAAYNSVAVTDDSNINPAGLNGGIDGDGSSLSAQQLAGIGVTPGGPVSHGGFTFAWPAPAAGQPDNVLADGQTIQLSGSGHTLGLLTTGTYTPPPGTLTVTYTDGTTTTATISDPDWQAAPPAGSDVAITTTYHNWTGAGRVNRNAYLYLHAVPLDPAKTVASVTLPAIGDHTTGGTPALHVFALALS
jgi:glycosyl hydrolase family 20